MSGDLVEFVEEEIGELVEIEIVEILIEEILIEEI